MCAKTTRPSVQHGQNESLNVQNTFDGLGGLETSSLSCPPSDRLVLLSVRQPENPCSDRASFVHVSSPARLGQDFQDSLYFHKNKGNQKVTMSNRPFISSLRPPECDKSICNGYWHAYYVAETRSAPNSHGERSLLVQDSSQGAKIP